MFLIGSRAANFHGLKIHRSIEKSDWDIIGSKQEFEFFRTCYPDAKIKEFLEYPGKYHVLINNIMVEFDATQNPSNEMIPLLGATPHHFTIGDKKTLLFVPSKKILFQIKRSHVPFGIHFDKSIMDLRSMMKQWNMYGEEYQDDFYQARYDEAKARFGKKQERIKLNKPNEEFFKGGMSLRTYVHDDLHKAVAFYDEPMFERCKKDMNSAAVSKELFFQMPKEDQQRMAMEESMVIALEREYIPNRAQYILYSPSQMTFLYRKGMLKEIKDLSKGWFQAFMIDNILDIEVPKWNFIERFEDALLKNKLRKVGEI